MEITFENRLILKGKLQVRVKFAEMIDDHYYSADVGVWVTETDSWEKTRAMAIEEANKFLEFLVSNSKPSIKHKK